MMRLCGYNSIKSTAATAHTGFSIREIGIREARFFGMAKEDLDGSEARRPHRGAEMFLLR